MPELTAKADKIRETIRKQSFDGEFFVDNAVRKDGKLESPATAPRSASTTRSSSTWPRPKRTPSSGRR